MTSNVVRNPRPRQSTHLAAFPVADELVLVSPDGECIYTLNQSGQEIWKLCDGFHTLPDMLHELRERYDGADVNVLADLSAALLQMQALNLVETAPPVFPGDTDSATIAVAPTVRQQPRLRFVFGIEDRAYFHWQIAILFESLVGQLPTDWAVVVVVCNDHQPLSAELAHILEAYGVRHVTGTNHRDSYPIDFAAGPHGYVALNRVEALSAIGSYVEPDDIVCLMDTDIFLYGELQVDLFPSGNAMAANWIIEEERFFSFSAAGKGIDLQKLLESFGCTTPLKRGGVTVFLTGATVSNRKVIRDCFRFAQVLYLLGKVADLPERGVWTAEMACFAMSLPPNGIDYDLLTIPQFSVHDPRPETLPEGTFFHYYVDPNDGGGGPFLGSEWNKQLFADRNFLLENLDSFFADAQSDPEKRFLEVARKARRRLYGPDAG